METDVSSGTLKMSDTTGSDRSSEVMVEELVSQESAWDDYVLRHPDATGYHLIIWRDIIQRTFGHPAFYLTAKDSRGHIRGVLPLIFIASRLFGRVLVSLPFVNYGGVLADDETSAEALLNMAIRLAMKLSADHIELRHQQSSGIRWRNKQHKVSMRLQLSVSFEALWNKFPAKLRSQIRRAAKEGMIFRLGKHEVLDDFYAVFSRNMRDLGTPVYGKHFFLTILECFPRSTQIGIVYLDNEPVAAGFLYGFREVLEIPWASSDRRFNRMAPNMLLYSSVLKYGCEHGFSLFDFGRSTLDGGTYRFKAQWGAQPVPLHWYYWVANGGPLPDVSPTNSKYKLAVGAWKRLPLAMTRCFGPAIVRFIP